MASPGSRGGAALYRLAFWTTCCAESDPGKGVLNGKGRAVSKAARLFFLGLDPCQVMGPLGFAVAAQLVEVLPGVEAGVVAVVEDQLHGVLADRLDGADADGLFTEHQGFLAGAVALHLGRGGIDTQVLERQLEPAAVLESDFQQAGGPAELDFYGVGVGRHLHYYGRPCSSSGTSWKPQTPPTPTTFTVWSIASGPVR